MPWRPAPNNTFYRSIVGTGLFLRWLFQIDVQVQGLENLPTPDPIEGKARKPIPGRGAVIAITHFGYLDFAVASLVMWRHAKVQMRYLIHKGGPTIGSPARRFPPPAMSWWTKKPVVMLICKPWRSSKKASTSRSCRKPG
jgi:1-acyl-sn-glycerol-3-phosphate acyltransferase